MTQPSSNLVSTLKSRFEFLATILVVLVSLTVGGFELADRLRPAPSRGVGVKPVLTSIPIHIAGTPVMGSSEAKVALVLFSDFECPVCARTALEVLPQLRAKYIDTGKVLLVWRHFPLPIHPSARRAAEAAECAGKQGQFWQLHDWAFTHQSDLGSERLRDAAERLGLSLPSFEKCTGGEAAEKVADDVVLGKQLGVSGTPAWFIGTVEQNGTVKAIDRVNGLGPVEMYEEAIDKVLRSR